MAPLLKVRDLSVSFVTDTHKINAVRDVNFDIAPGEKLGFVGESGSGKTTTALALMGLVPNPGRVTNGVAKMGDLDLLGLSRDEIKAERLRTISYIPQGAMNSLNPVQKVRDSVLDGMEDHGVRMGRGERRAVVSELMEKAGLPRDASARYPHELSGGMKQRACIAVAIALKPRLLIADEPTSALDVITQRRVMQTLDRVQGELGSGLILIGHDMGLMAQFVDRLVVMREGRIVEVGSTRQVFKSPRAAYTRELITSVPAMPVRRPALQVCAGDRPGHVEDDDTLLSLENASKTYQRGIFKKDVVALKPVSLRFSRSNPKIIAMVGQSGSGKSACGNLMLGFQKPTTGRIMFGGRDVATMKRREKTDFRRQVQAVFQDPYASFNPFYTIDHAFTVPLRRFGVAANRAEAYDIMAHSLQRVGLEPGATFGSHAHQLSGGQRQRIMVARAVALRPKLIVADEPVSMVDASLRATILENIRQLRDDFGISVFYITHDLATAYRSSDGVIVLRRGRVVEAGLPDEVICDPKHPYTVQLVESIPSPDPDQAWARVREPQEARSGEDADTFSQAVIRSRIPGFSIRSGTAA
ncbi:MAG: ABC transporter ATP-binding protein [Paracoccaceae bacterium]|nr:ABC transporter ATP-binding protein [Paracoccaceae bacterium]